MRKIQFGELSEETLVTIASMGSDMAVGDYQFFDTEGGRLHTILQVLVVMLIREEQVYIYHNGRRLGRFESNIKGQMRSELLNVIWTEVAEDAGL